MPTKYRLPFFIASLALLAFLTIFYTGDAKGSAAPINQAALTANLAIRKIGSGAGIVTGEVTGVTTSGFINCSSYCLYNFATGTSIHLLAVPGLNSRFVIWDLIGEGTNFTSQSNPIDFNFNSSTLVQATFVKNYKIYLPLILK